MQNILETAGGNAAWIIELIMLTVGGLFLARGLKIYKAMQAILCALLGGSIGLFLHSYFGRQEFYIVAVILAFLGLFLGIRYYKFGLYILASLSAWLAVFSYFWKAAMALLREGMDGLMDTKQILLLWLDNSMKTSDFMRALSETAGNEISGVTQTAEAVMHKLQTGLLWAGAAGIIFGILALVLGDFIIIFVTSAMGATILITLLEMFLQLVPSMHLLVLVLLTGTGIVLQSFMQKR